MAIQVDLPADVLALLGPDPEREVVEGVLLHLLRERRLSVARAGELLGLTRHEAIRWFTQKGHPYPNADEEDLLAELAAPDRTP